MLIRVKANELHDATVEFISLVKNGAIRIPFRITKSTEGGMIDLKTLFTKSEPETSPAIVAILVSKDADLDKAKARIVGAGFSTDNEAPADSGPIFYQSDEADGKAVADAQIIKFDDDLAIAVSKCDLKKAFEEFNFESVSFKEMMAQEGAIPSIRVAKEVLSDTIHNILHKADSPSEAANEVSAAIEDFKNFVSGVLSNVPVQAFKLEADPDPAPVKEVEDKKGVKQQAAGEGTEGAGTDQSQQGAASEGQEGKGSEGDEEDDEKKNSASNSDGAKAPDVLVLKEIEKLSKSLGDAISGIGGKLTDLAKVVDANSQRIEVVAKAGDEVKKAAEGTVSGDPQEDNLRGGEGLETEVVKSAGGLPTDGEGYIMIDTAIHGRGEDA